MGWSKRDCATNSWRSPTSRAAGWPLMRSVAWEPPCRFFSRCSSRPLWSCGFHGIWFDGVAVCFRWWRWESLRGVRGMVFRFGVTESTSHACSCRPSFWARPRKSRAAFFSARTPFSSHHFLRRKKSNPNPPSPHPRACPLFPPSGALKIGSHLFPPWLSPANSRHPIRFWKCSRPCLVGAWRLPTTTGFFLCVAAVAWRSQPSSPPKSSSRIPPIRPSISPSPR